VRSSSRIFEDDRDLEVRATADGYRRRYGFTFRFDIWIAQAEDEQGLDDSSHVRVVMGCDLF
jgi:hypothetical protein